MHDTIAREARRRRAILARDAFYRHEVTAEFFAAHAQLATDYLALVRACRDRGGHVPREAVDALDVYQRRLEGGHMEAFGTPLYQPERARYIKGKQP